MAARKVGKLTTPKTRWRGSADSLQRQASRVGQRSLGADQQMCEIDVAVAGVGPFALIVERYPGCSRPRGAAVSASAPSIAVAMACRELAHELARSQRRGP